MFLFSSLSCSSGCKRIRKFGGGEGSTRVRPILRSACQAEGEGGVITGGRGLSAGWRRKGGQRLY